MTNMKELDKIALTTHIAVKPYLKEAINTHVPSSIKKMLGDCLNLKKLYDRALFVRLGCEAACGNWRDILCAMSAAELMDLSVIVIDDILDGTPRRQGKPTIHIKYGIKNALIMAGILKSISTEHLIGLEKCIEVNRLNISIKLLEESHRNIYIGQYLDILYENFAFDKIKENMYLEMIKYTTGSQISSCLKIGGLLGGGKKDEIKSLGEYGMNVGIIYQMRDDLVDYDDNESEIGKVPFMDLIKRKKRWPILFAYEKNRKKVDKLLKSRPVNKMLIKSSIIDPDIIDRAKRIMNSYGYEAQNKIKNIRNKRTKKVLEQIISHGIDI